MIETTVAFVLQKNPLVNFFDVSEVICLSWHNNTCEFGLAVNLEL